MSDRVLRLGLEQVILQATYEPGYGWRLLVVARHQGESFDDGERSTYQCLSNRELLDVIECEAWSVIEGVLPPL